MMPASWSCVAPVVILLTAVAGSGCRQGEPQQTPAADRGAPTVRRDQLHPASIPDLAGAEPGLQERVRTRYTSLAATRDRADASDAEVAAAYGEVGKLLIAAELFADAEP